MKRSKWTRFFSGSAAAVLILCSAAFFSGCNPSVTAGKAANSFKVEIVSTQEDTENYVIDLQTPVVHGTENADSINKEIQKDIDGYMNEVKSCSADASTDNALNAKCSLYIQTFQYVNSRDGCASLLLDSSNYTGGAHGMNWYQAYNINTEDGSMLRVEDLFKDPQAGLTLLRQQVLDKIQEEPEVYFPSAKEYVNGLETFRFYLVEGKLVLWFDPYELAPYAAGLITIELPFDELDGFRFS